MNPGHIIDLIFIALLIWYLIEPDDDIDEDDDDLDNAIPVH